MTEIDTKSYENNLMQQRRGSILINYKLGQLIRQMVELETEKQNLLPQGFFPQPSSTLTWLLLPQYGRRLTLGVPARI